MDEVSGALVGIALVLSSVFVPAAFIAGITGALYRQFALTIAFSVLISAFNALTLSPALGALILRPRSKDARRGLLGRFFNGFDRAFATTQTGYVRVCGFLIRKVVVALGAPAAFTVLAGGLGKIMPTSFLPQEDQGFFLMNVQLPEAASMQRTNDVMRKIEEILKAEPGGALRNAISGYASCRRRRARQRCLLRTARTVRGAGDTRDPVGRDRHVREPEAVRAADAKVFAFLPPAIPAAVRRRRRRLHPGPRGHHRRLPLAEHAAVHGPRCRSGRDRGFLATTYAPRCRSSSPRRRRGPVFQAGACRSRNV